LRGGGAFEESTGGAGRGRVIGAMGEPSKYGKEKKPPDGGGGCCGRREGCSNG